MRTIDSIRSFDPETQRSGESLQSVRLLPAREYPITGEGIKDFAAATRARFGGRSGALAGVQTSNRRPGARRHRILPGAVLRAARDFVRLSAAANAHRRRRRRLFPSHKKAWSDIGERYEQRRHDVERPVLKPQEIFLQPHELLRTVHAHP